MNKLGFGLMAGFVSALGIVLVVVALGSTTPFVRLSSITTTRSSDSSQLNEAIAAYNTGDYASALTLVRPLAERGNASAQGMLGNMYFNGWGLKQNPASAIRWLEAAGNQGLASAETKLGAIYYQGLGVEKNFALAKAWFERGAYHDNASAQGMLSLMLERGEGSQQDYTQAAFWRQKAADQGDVNAQYLLGLMYYRGRGVQQDYVRAFMWLALASEKTPNIAGERDSLARLLSRDQLNEAYRLIRERNQR